MFLDSSMHMSFRDVIAIKTLFNELSGNQIPRISEF